MKFAAGTIIVAAFLWMLFTPAQAAEVDFAFIKAK